MKFKNLFIAVLSVSLLTVVACKKDKEEAKPKTTAEKIQTKWSVQDYTIHQHEVNQDTSATFPASTADYFDIRADNKIYVNLYPQSDTLDYELKDDSTILIKGLALIGDDGTYKIRNLTDNTLSLYLKEFDPGNANQYVELTFNLKK